MSALEARKVKNGTSWRFVYRNDLGQQKKVKIGVTTKRIAEQRKAQLDAMLSMGKDPVLELKTTGSILLSDLIKEDASWCENRRQPRTIQINREIMKRFIEWMGNVESRQVTKQKIEEYLLYCIKSRNYKVTTLDMHRRQLSSIFNRAVKEHQLLKENPFADIKPYADKTRRDRAQFLSLEEIDILLKATSSDIHFNRLVRFYLLTGCRRGEALDLRWDEVDYRHNKLYLGQSKSKTKLRRDFPIRKELENLLKEAETDKDKIEYVFWRFHGRGPYISNRFTSLRKAHKELPDSLSPHLLRHTFASHLVMNQVDLRTVASFMGHNTTKVTELYSHLAESHREKALDNLPY
jgi:integrase